MLKLLKWFIMLNKRLYKKIAFIAILIIVPVCVLALNFAAEQQSGFLKICLAQQNPNDAISKEVINDFLKEDSLIHFTYEANPQKALENVKNGSCDAVWMFNANTKAQIDKFIDSRNKKDAAVQVIVREQTVLTRLSQEKLSSAMYKYCTEEAFINYMKNNVIELKDIDDATFKKYYNDVAISDELFKIENIDAFKQTTGNYMTAPIRGILAVLILLASAAATMFYMQDDKNGTFSLVKETKKPFVAFFCVLIATLNVAAVSLITLFASKLSTNIFKEIVCILLYSVCSTAFCLLLKQILFNVKIYGAALPVVIVIMLAICPIFIGSEKGWNLLPPTYYIFSLYDNGYLLNMAIFTFILLALTALLEFIKNKIKISL